MTPAESLRAAAERIRKTATAAPSEPWTVEGECYCDRYPDDAMENGGCTHAPTLWSLRVAGDHQPILSFEAIDFRGERTAVDHAALWSPPVALAVADWLDDEAERVEQNDDDDAYLSGQMPALALAELILGGVL